MAKLKDVLDLLKKQGVEIGAEAAAAVMEKFDGQQLVPADKLIGEGQIAVSETAWNDRGEDLTKWKNRAKKAEGDYKELKEASDSGDSVNKILADKQKVELDRLKPLVDKFTKGIKKRWEEAKEKIPENLRKYYSFAEEGKELSDEQVSANVEKLTEHLDLKAFELEGSPTPGGTPKTPPGGKPSARGAEDLDDKSTDQKILDGYGKKASD